MENGCMKITFTSSQMETLYWALEFADRWNNMTVTLDESAFEVHVNGSKYDPETQCFEGAEE
jgi:hypothetical protein